MFPTTLETFFANRLFGHFSWESPQYPLHFSWESPQCPLQLCKETSWITHWLNLIISVRWHPKTLYSRCKHLVFCYLGGLLYSRLWHIRHLITRTYLYTCLKQRCAKKSTPCFIWKASRCVADRTSKTTTFLSFTFYITRRSYENIICIYFLFHWFSGENCIIVLFSLNK